MNFNARIKEKVIFNWSGGKDSAYCLYKILQEGQYDILCLLTTISEPYQRISMHGVRVELLNAQAERIGLPLLKVQIPEMPSMQVYDNTMAAALLDLKNRGTTASIFGDIFLEDLRRYREDKLSEFGLRGIFPLWKIPTKILIRKFIDSGFKAITTCVNEKYLDKSFVGRIINDDFLNDLPDNVDPCGENGEFHSFVFDAPIYKKPILFEKGEIVYKKYPPSKPEKATLVDASATNQNDTDNLFDSGFWYCELFLR
ncbi:MAG: diphthine--ammonia ligase [Bacteroidales bacterium]|nr:diphthine--ammonia ligase [Bacteroidales bacterium]